MLALIDALDDADALLHRVYGVECRRPTAPAVVEAAGALRLARAELVDFLRLAAERDRPPTALRPVVALAAGADTPLTGVDPTARTSMSDPVEPLEPGHG